MNNKFLKYFLIFFLLNQIAFSQKSGFRPFFSDSAMVATADKYATETGYKILKNGGNAVDAAVGVAMTLSVTYPYAGNLGGGGFMLIHDENGNIHAIDYREKAPEAATADMFLGKDGNVKPNESLVGYKAAAVPGTIAGLWAAHSKFGKLKWEKLFNDAIKLAENGFIIDAYNAQLFKKYSDYLIQFESTAKIFLKNGKPYQKNDLLIQKDLAKSLKIIAKEGHDGFYKGKIARLIEAEMLKNDGLIMYNDLKNYQVKWRVPINFDYRGYSVFTMPPPSSGGLVIAQILQSLENFDLQQIGQNSSETIHLWSEVSKQAFADRSQFMGDPDFFHVPIERIKSKDYSKIVFKQINPFQARPSSSINPNSNQLLSENDETTHFSIVDASGIAVSNTYTLNSGFGCKVIIEGTGMFLNNEMDDFSIKPGVPNQYGLIGSEANKIEPAKRMLSSMTPAIVTKDKRLFLVLGSPGGSRIMNAVAQVLSNVIDYNFNIREAVEAARFHHQWLPDTLYLENDRFTSDTINNLKIKGYNIGFWESIGNVNAILINQDRTLQGWSDPRRNGTVTGY